MSYIMLALGLYACVQASAIALVQTLLGYADTHLNQRIRISYHKALFHCAMGIVLMLGSIYVNDWPKL